MKVLRGLFLGLYLLLSYSNIETFSLYTFKEGSVIRDLEFESFIKKITKPIFKVAGLEHKKLKVFLIVDDNVNAFVTIGDRMYIHSGLINKFPKVSNLVGVLAHEIGHIAGGHVTKTYWESQKIGRYSLAMAAAGFLTAMLNPEAGIFMMMGGAGSATNAFLHYSRMQESSADHAAMEYLTKLGWGVDGLYDVMDHFKRQEYFTVSMQDKYLRTHPISEDRVRSVRNFKNNYKNNKYHKKSLFPKAWKDDYKVIRAKIIAYTQNPIKVLREYDINKNKDKATIYANAIAHLRMGMMDESEKYIDQLIKQDKNNPFALETKSMILTNKNQIKQAREYIVKAINEVEKAKGDSDLLKLDQASLLLRSNDKNDYQKALNILEGIEDSPEKRTYTYWHYKAIAHGKLKQMDQMALSLAEKYMIIGNIEAAKKQCYRAKVYAKNNKTIMANIDDVLQEIQTIEDEESYFF